MKSWLVPLMVSALILAPVSASKAQSHVELVPQQAYWTSSSPNVVGDSVYYVGRPGALMDEDDPKNQEGLFRLNLSTGEVEQLYGGDGQALSFRDVDPVVSGNDVFISARVQVGEVQDTDPPIPQYELGIVRYDLSTGSMLPAQLQTVDARLSMMRVSPDGQQLYLGLNSWYDSTTYLVAVDPVTQAVRYQTSMHGEELTAMELSPDGSTVFFLDERQNLTVVEASSGTILTTTRIAGSRRSSDLAVSFDGLEVYIPVSYKRNGIRAGLVAIYSVPNQKVVATIPVGRWTHSVAADPQRRVAYVTSFGPGDPSHTFLSVIDSERQMVTGTATLTKKPIDVGLELVTPASQIAVSATHRLAAVPIAAGEESGAAMAVVAVDDIPETPSAPDGIKVLVSGDRVTAKWEQPESGSVDSYRAVFNTKHGTEIDVCSSTDRTCSFTAPFSSGGFRVTVQARNEQGWGPVAMSLKIKVP